MATRRPMKMSAALRTELEDIARKCNDYMPHEAGDALEIILGYPVGDFTNPKERPESTAPKGGAR